MAIAIDPTICTRKSRHYVEIECEGVYTRGMTVVDERNVTATDADYNAIWRPLRRIGSPNATVCWEIDVRRWKELLYDLLD
jgi:inosine-uridine nucleoside N-ribohydrolase